MDFSKCVLTKAALYDVIKGSGTSPSLWTIPLALLCFPPILQKELKKEPFGNNYGILTVVLLATRGTVPPPKEITSSPKSVLFPKTAIQK